MKIKISNKNNHNENKQDSEYEVISEQLENLEGEFCHDLNGNVFLVINNNNKQNYYSLNIDKNDEIEFYQIDPEKLVNLDNSEKMIYEKIIDSEFTSLKKKTLDSIENDDNSDQEEDFQNYKQKIKYLNEDKYYYTNFKNENSDDENDKFNFNKKDNIDLILLIDKGIDVVANYDTYVRDKEKNVLLSLILNSGNAYRISFYNLDNNDFIIELNIIGSTIKTYKIYFNNEINENSGNENSENGIKLICEKINQKNNF